MVFKTTKVKRRGPGRPPKRKTPVKNKKYSQNWGLFKTVMIVLFCWALLTGLVWTWFIYNKYLKELPPITTLWEIKQPEASVFYDKDWNEFYTFSLSEKRTYVGYNDISQNIVNWVISIEDKTFFTNSWVDAKAIVRSIFNKVTWKTDDFVWTSTISQQLIKNVFLTNEKRVERKIKEAYLSYLMNKKYSKETIMEIYLNKLEFWSNAFWVEQATKTFFNKSARDVNILEASMIASLPKSPTLYSPYKHYGRLVWHSYSYERWTPDDKNYIKSKKQYLENKEYYEKVKELIWNLSYVKIEEEWKDAVLCWIDKDFYKKPNEVEDSCIVIWANGILRFLNDIIIDWKLLWNEEISNTIYEYQTWRKDNVLWRMLEEDFITFDEYKNSIIASLGFEFNKPKESLKYPHFTMHVREYLIQNYGKEFLEQGWLKVYTTLDPELQAKAEEIVKKQAELNSEKFDAKNASLVSIDNRNGAIVAMVWSADYFNDEIDGQVNIMTAPRKPWSTFKPLVYAIAMENYGFGSKSPIFDLETAFDYTDDPYTPNNFDGKFMWKMDVSTALNNSRNVPAVKMYFLAGHAKKITPFLEKIWIDTSLFDVHAWASMSLWSQDLKWLELAWAYSVFANLWYKKEITPILEIKDANGNTIEKLRNLPWELVMDPGLAYITNEILSTTDDRPEFWNSYLALPERKVAAKTWTATQPNFDVPKIDNKAPQYPSDLWTIWYTPEFTTVAWAWNNEGTTNFKWNGLEWAWPMWNEFMKAAHENISPSIWNRPNNVESIKISSISWLLAPSEFPEEFKISSLFLKWTIPGEYDNWMKKVLVDSLCNWKAWKNTPPGAVKEAYYVPLKVIDERQSLWVESLNKWIDEGKANSLFENYPNIITNFKDQECKRSQALIDNSAINFTSNIKDKDLFAVWNNEVSISVNSWNPVVRVDFIMGGQVIDSIAWNNKTSGNISWKITIPKSLIWPQRLTVRVYDNIYYSEEKTYVIGVLSKDTVKPTITLINPVDNEHNLYEWQFFNLRANITDRSHIRSVNVYMNWSPLKLWLLTKDLVFPINENKNMSPWVYTIKIEAIDQFFNKASKEVILNIMEK